MREISVPAVVRVEPHENLTDVVVRNAEEVPDLPLLARRVGGGWQDVSAARFRDEVVAVAKGLVAAGVAPGDRVALLAKTRYEWTLVDVAIWFAGAVTVPVYETSSPEQVRWILTDSEASAAIVETPDHRVMLSGLQTGQPGPERIWALDEGAVAELVAAGAGVSDEEIERRRRTLTAGSVATLIYTSGTTGRPKGCELSHSNFLELARNSAHVFHELVREGKSTLLFLPLAHVFARYIQVLCLVGRARLGHSPSVANLVADLGEFRPTFLLAVPRVFEKIYNSAEAKAQAAGGAKTRIFDLAVRTAIEYSRAQDTGGPGLALRVRHALVDRLVLAKLREATGGRVEGAVSGGAPLGERLGHFFRGVGMPVLEGWGLTETTAPATVNLLSLNKVGTVGRPLPGVAVRVATDGELEVRGSGVMIGYHRNDEATAAVLRDGWFATGDLGEIDDDGYVRITGRKKEIIITAGGKNVVPAVREDRMRAHPLISQCVVVGDQRPFIGALITLDAEMLPTWLANRGRPALGVREAAADPFVRAELQKAVDDANTLVSRAESIRKFDVLPVDLTEAGGHLTPKQSLRRAVVMKEFATEIDGLYS